MKIKKVWNHHLVKAWILKSRSTVVRVTDDSPEAFLYLAHNSQAPMAALPSGPSASLTIMCPKSKGVSNKQRTNKEEMDGAKWKEKGN